MGVKEQQKITLVAATFVALSSGTNYAISSYAPQLASRLELSITQLNYVSTAANFGMYLTGSFVGPIIDKRGPRIVLLTSSLVLFTGWTLMRLFYDGGTQGIFSAFGVSGIALAQVLTGIGSSMSNGAASNGVARSFGVKRRATALSVVICCTGLSAFVYSTTSRILFHSNPNGTSYFLLLLSLGCSITMLVGSIFVHPAKFPTGHPGPGTSTQGPSTSVTVPSETQPLLSNSQGARPTAVTVRNIKGWQLVSTVDFWILFGVEGLLAGVGLMYLNNLGTMINTLWLTLDAPLGKIPAAQADLVSTFSICNAIGRIVIGATSDYFSHRAPPRFRFERVWFAVPVSALFALSLFLASRTDYVKGWHGLIVPTAMMGCSYGFLWGLMPVLCLDWFGLKSYSSNNGLLVLSPALFGQFTNYQFGHIYDSHTRSSPFQASQISAQDVSTTARAFCGDGRLCYEGALRMAVAMSLGAMVLSVVAGLRRMSIAKMERAGDTTGSSDSRTGGAIERRRRMSEASVEEAAEAVAPTL
ncbi:MFS general substrate transporter [Meredithblackwellia eburnea MCA 4105]